MRLLFKCLHTPGRLIFKQSNFNKIFSKKFHITRFFSSNNLTYDNELVKNYVSKLSSLFDGDPAGSLKLFPEYEYEQIRRISLKNRNIAEKNEEVSFLKSSLDGESDGEMLKMMQEEIKRLQIDVESLKDEIVALLYPEDSSTNDDVILEVNSGVGGQEAMLFTSEILNMYFNYVHFKNWSMNLINQDMSDLGGIRHATLFISGLNAFHRLKFEGGVHRVQRTPKTEKTGRLHTSTMTVAVYLQTSEVEVNLNAKDLKIETCKSSGKGGQHVNTTDSAVRVVHVPTGISAECQNERSQIKNKEMALKLLRTKIFEKQNENIKNEITDKRRIQVGRANRNEKVRTYNFKDDRISDHRINFNMFGLREFFEGSTKLDELIDNLIFASKQEFLINRIDDFCKEVKS